MKAVYLTGNPRVGLSVENDSVLRTASCVIASAAKAIAVYFGYINFDLLFFAMPTPDEVAMKKLTRFVSFGQALKDEIDSYFNAIDQDIMTGGQPPQCLVRRLPEFDTLPVKRIKFCRLIFDVDSTSPTFTSQPRKRNLV